MIVEPRSRKSPSLQPSPEESRYAPIYVVRLKSIDDSLDFEAFSSPPTEAASGESQVEAGNRGTAEANSLERQIPCAAAGDAQPLNEARQGYSASQCPA